MAELIIMPKLGFNMSEGKLVQWYKKEGDAIRKGENLFSVETDKTNMDIEATSDGVVRKLLIEEGDQIPVTLPIAIVGDRDEDIADMLGRALQTLGKADAAPAGESAPAKQDVAETDAPEAAPTGRDYDILVIGGGPGGYVAAIKAAQMGKKTALLEKDKLGGTCLNEGCIPTKTLLRSAEILAEAKRSAEFGVTGVDAARVGIDMTKVQERKRGVVGQLVDGVEGLLRSNGVTVYRGEGSLADKHTVAVGGKEISADFIIIATGSKTKSLPIPISPQMNLLTSAEALELTALPKSIVVIGGGVIGVELAYFLAEAGVRTVIVEFLERILPAVDAEITQKAESVLQKKGVTIHTGAKVTEITAGAVLFEKNGKAESVEAECVLMAVGREPRLDGVDCARHGIRTEKGAIWTDAGLKTSVDNIYAVGDVNGKGMLAHIASAEGIIAVENICGRARGMDYRQTPGAIYIQPEIAYIGLTEEQASKEYGDLRIGKFPIAANGKSKAAGENEGLIKVIAEAKYGEIVGVHLFAPHATEMIAEASLAMRLEATAEEVASAIHPHPTVSESIQEAMHAVGGRAIHC